MTILRCKKCNDWIEGDKKGTYIKCECGAIAIDETEYYCRVIGNKEDFEILKNINISYLQVKDLLLKLEQCDSLHNNCDYLLEHSDIDLLLNYINGLETENKKLWERHNEEHEQICKAIQYINNHSLNFNNEIETDLQVEEVKELANILRGEDNEK